MKGGSTSQVIMEMQLKTKIKYHYTTNRMARIQNTDNTKCYWGCGAIGNLTLEKHRGALKAYCHVKKANLKRLHIVQFQVWHSEKGKTIQMVKR